MCGHFDCIRPDPRWRRVGRPRPQEQRWLLVQRGTSSEEPTMCIGSHMSPLCTREYCTSSYISMLDLRLDFCLSSKEGIHRCIEKIVQGHDAVVIENIIIPTSLQHNYRMAQDFSHYDTPLPKLLPSTVVNKWDSCPPIYCAVCQCTAGTNHGQWTRLVRGVRKCWWGREPARRRR